ncbi:hypothetical protein AALA13_00655 [Lachnospiraceae bacterium 50-23]|jgi:hypothetical protein
MMSDSEKRRKELLEQTRERYSDYHTPPAVHPRYGSAYSQIYGNDELPVPGTLGIRAFFCFLLFTIFVAADYKEEKILNVSSEKIVEAIRTDMDVQEVWQNL